MSEVWSSSEMKERDWNLKNIFIHYLGHCQVQASWRDDQPLAHPRRSQDAAVQGTAYKITGFSKILAQLLPKVSTNQNSNLEFSDLI